MLRFFSALTFCDLSVTTKLTHLQNFGLFLYHLPWERLGGSANRVYTIPP